jgi:hypothetical protein
MDLDTVELAVKALVGFVTGSERDLQGRGKLVGIIGGEPLLHPQFPDIVDIMLEHVPRVGNRGLWTSKDWKNDEHPKWGPMRPQVERLVGHHDKLGRGTNGKKGWLNWNMHLAEMRVQHQPVLAASRDLVPNPVERWKLIENCWLQRSWSPSITPNGFYFCEVAAALDEVIGDKSHGLPIEPGCWEGDLDFITARGGIRQPTGKFAEQVEWACQQCGVCVPMPGRPDSDEIDDVSPSHMKRLHQIESPRLKKGRVNVVKSRDTPRGKWNPRRYIKGKIPVDQAKESKR